MSKKLFLWLIALLFAGIVAASPAISSSIDLILLDSDIHVGETFDVQVIVNRDQLSTPPDSNLGLTSFGFDTLDGTGSIFSFAAYTLHDPFWGDLTVQTDTDPFYPFVGNILFPADYAPSVMIATLSFDALAVGSDLLTVSGLYDGTFYGLMYEFFDPFLGTGINLGEYGVDSFDIFAELPITVNEFVIPEPATMLLFGLGLIGLAGMGRKKRSYI